MFHSLVFNMFMTSSPTRLQNMHDLVVGRSEAGGNVDPPEKLRRRHRLPEPTHHAANSSLGDRTAIYILERCYPQLCRCSGKKPKLRGLLLSLKPHLHEVMAVAWWTVYRATAPICWVLQLLPHSTDSCQVHESIYP